MLKSHTSVVGTLFIDRMAVRQENRCVVVEFPVFHGDHNEYVVTEFTVVDVKTALFVTLLFAPLRRMNNDYV